MELGLAGKIAVVTGAGRGVGRAEALGLAAEGVRLVVNDLDPQSAEATCAAINENGIEAVAVSGDASDENDVRSVIDAAIDKFGQVDFLINNAGAGPPHMGHRVEDLSVGSWDKIIDTHLRSTFLFSKYAIATMKKNHFGRIINTASMHVDSGGREGICNYTTAKAGIAGFTRNLAKEVAVQGITVNAVAPGYVETELIGGFSAETRQAIIDQNPVGRFCRPDEVATLVAFLCSNKADYITGAIIPIDGGRREFTLC